MIIEIKVANYRSINAEQTLSFVAEKAVRHPGNLITQKGYKLLKAVALFGANASGKSNFLRALAFAIYFMNDSATRYNEGDPIPFSEPFRLDFKSRRAPSSFEISFLNEQTLYRYGFSADTERVHTEYLYTQKATEKEETLLFERGYDGIMKQSTWEFGGSLASVKSMLEQRTRSNALLLSVGARENVPELLIPYSYFREHTATMSMCSNKDELIRTTATEYAKGGKLQDRILTLLKSADIDIEAINIEQQVFKFASATDPAMPVELRTLLALAGSQAGGLSRHLITASRKDNAGRMQNFDFINEESEGTQRLFAILGPLLDALDSGSFIIIDEIDASMHPLLTRRLLELFQSPEANPKGAQLLFTTHDPALLDQELFRRDQIWLVEKRQGASEFYSLADVDPAPRNTEAFLRNYLAGRYGGTPQIGLPFDFALKQAE